MPATITVPYEMLYDSFSENGDNRSVSATVSYLVDFDNRWTFVQEVIGKSESVGEANSSIIRTIPMQHPHNGNLYATSFSMTPIGTKVPGSTKLDHSIKSVVTVTYEFPMFDYDQTQGDYSQPYKTISIKSDANFMLLPASAFKMQTQYGGQDVPVVTNPGVQIAQMQVSITSHQLLDLPIANILPYIGTVNDDVFYGFSRGTLMFLSMDASRSPMAQGVMSWTCTYSFQWRTIEWNKYYSPAPGVGWDYLVDRITEEPIIAYTDFTKIP